MDQNHYDSLFENVGKNRFFEDVWNSPDRKIVLSLAGCPGSTTTFYACLSGVAIDDYAIGASLLRNETADGWRKYIISRAIVPSKTMGAGSREISERLDAAMLYCEQNKIDMFSYAPETIFDTDSESGRVFAHQQRAKLENWSVPALPMGIFESNRQPRKELIEFPQSIRKQDEIGKINAAGIQKNLCDRFGLDEPDEAFGEFWHTLALFGSAQLLSMLQS